MQVLKKFGFIALPLVLTSVLSISQNKERIEPNSKFNFKKSMVISDDIPLLRMVTKTEPTTFDVKKEEPSFTSNMLDWVKDKYSSMIDVMPNQISNVMLYRFIDEWYGVKYRMGGTTKKGVDCSAFVQHLYQYVFGYDILRTACLQFKESRKIAKDDLKEGDLVFFKVGTSRISHVGVYLRNNFFVHSASSKGVSIANLSNAYWSRYFAGGGRIVKE
jgi:lipoprotein Spr